MNYILESNPFRTLVPRLLTLINDKMKKEKNKKIISNIIYKIKRGKTKKKNYSIYHK